ncbi:unnamed protein product [Ranitomeya imitator]|uniref:Uncharacterized protein n=1 Tax=Ranitomeya imitator TaxID=111125 RepID=A0ABN9LYG0_9NEOB|nr:unnamed protein product [Ranitomeya imitator]
MLIILLVRGVTLPGAYDGIVFYLKPDITRLKDPQVWMGAGTQISSHTHLPGCLTALGSKQKYNNNCYRDCIALCFLNSFTSFCSCFAIFSVLGFMAREQGVPISQVAKSGPGASIYCLTKSSDTDPVSPLWSCLFFLMLIFLGLDSRVACTSSTISIIMRQWGRLLCWPSFKWSVSGGFKGADRFYDNIEDIIGYRPWPLRLKQLVTPHLDLPQPKKYSQIWEPPEKWRLAVEAKDGPHPHQIRRRGSDPRYILVTGLVQPGGLLLHHLTLYRASRHKQSKKVICYPPP